MDAKKRPVFLNLFLCALLLGIALELLLVLISLLLYHMHYLKLSFSRPMIFNLCFLLVLFPFLTGFLGLAAQEYRNGFWVRILSAFTLPSMLLGLLAAVLLCFFPPYCSSTTAMKHYLQFDRLSAEGQSAIQQVFPAASASGAFDSTAEGASGYQYYWYRSLLEDTLHVSLGVTLPAEAFEAEQERLLSLSLENSTLSREEGYMHLSAALPDALYIEVTLDEEYRRIIYSADRRILQSAS